MKKTYLGFSLMLFLLASINSYSQVTIWEEDFTYSDGTTQGSGTPPKWTRDVSNCTFGNGDHFEVRSNRMQGRDTDGEAIWYSESIDISTYSDVNITAELSETGNQENSDYIRIYYSLNGGAETLFSTNGDNFNDFGTVTASQAGLNGNNIIIVVRLINNNNNERHRIDNVVVFEPIAGDDCSGAIVISEVTNLPFSTTGATASGENPGCGGWQDPVDIWYAYTPATNGLVSVDLCGSSFDTRLAIWDACGGTALMCNDDDDNCGIGSTQSYLSGVVSAGITYYFQVGGYDSDTGDGDITITLTPLPSNNDCANATVIGEVTDLPFSTVAATASGENPGCGGWQDPVDIWFAYTPTANGSATVDLCGSSFDTRLAIWDACGGSVLLCNDNSNFCGGGSTQSYLSGVVSAGTTYYIQVGGRNSVIGTGDITITFAPTASNGDCANAIPIGEVTNYPFSTTTATASGEHPSCGGGQNPVDIWFAYTALTSGIATFDLCGSAYDTRLAIWDACGGTALECNDDNGPACNGFQSSIEMTVSAGNTYYIQVGGYNSETGNGDISISLVSFPANNNCNTATAINEVTDLPFSTTGATASGENPGCGGNPDPLDIWFAYTATLTGSATFDLCGSNYDTRLAVWDACGGTALVCNDDNDYCWIGSQNSYVTLNVISGNTYYVQVGGWRTEIGDGDLTIAVIPFGTNDDCANAIAINEVTDLPFTTMGATAGGDNPGCGGGQNPVDIWFAYSPTNTGLATFELCGSNFDTRLALWDACGGTALICNDDDNYCGNWSTQSLVQWVVSPGNTYFVQVGGYQSNVGTGDLTIFVSTIDLWTGNVNTDWGNTGNWSDGTVPNITSVVTIPIGVPNYPVIDEVAECRSIDINNGGQFTISTGGDLTVDTYFQNGQGTGGSFTMDDGSCTLFGNYYSEIGSTTDINNGTWSFDNWYQNSTSVWSKGTIQLSGGTINASGAIVWSNFDISGTIDGPVILNIGGTFRNSHDDWTITNGTINMLGTDGTGPFYFMASSWGAGNRIAAYNVNFNGVAGSEFRTNPDDNVTGVSIYNNLTVNSGFLNTEGLAGFMSDNISVAGTFTIGSLGEVTANVSGSFNVLGDANLLADQNRIASFIDNGNTNVIGAANVQQYMDSERWHLVSTPVTGATIFTYLDIYLKEYNESDDSWTYLINPTTIPINNAQGYSAWASDAFTGSTTVTYTGVLNTGDFAIPSLNYTLTSPNTGWNLIGNPYPSGLTWDGTWIKNNVSEWGCIHNNGNDGCYNAITGTEWPNAGDMPNGSLSPTQGLWVRATSDVASLTIPHNQRIHSSQTIYKNTKIEVEQTIRLRVDGNNDFDVVLVQFIPQATWGYDPLFDLEKRWGYDESPNIYSMVNGAEFFSVNVLPEVDEDLVIPIGLEVGANGDYVIQATELSDFPPDIIVVLEDIIEGTFTYLKEETSIEFYANIEDNNHRFNLHFKDTYIGIDNNIYNNINIYSYEDVIYIQSPSSKIKQVKIYDLLGHEILTENNLHSDINRIKMSCEKGYYIVKVRTEDNLYTEKVFIK